jgi:hypothetical protein
MHKSLKWMPALALLTGLGAAFTLRRQQVELAGQESMRAVYRRPV